MFIRRLNSLVPSFQNLSLAVLALSWAMTARPAAAASSVFTVPGSLTSTLDPSHPDVSGNLVVWRARQGSGWGVYSTNLATNQSATITARGTVYNDVAIGRNIVTWDDQRNGNPRFDIYAYDLNGGKEFPVDVGNYQTLLPDTDGKRIVWVDTRAGYSQVYSYDVQSQTENLVANASNLAPAATHPGISGDYVTYGVGGSLFYTNTATNTTREIGGNDAIRTNPAISGDTIVYQRRPSTNSLPDLYGFNLKTDKEFPIAIGNVSQNFDVSDRYVVWEDYRDGPINIYGYDLTTGLQFPIYTGNVMVGSPAIDGNLVVWAERWGDGTEAIRGAYLPEPTSATVLMLGMLMLTRRNRRRPACAISDDVSWLGR